MRELQKVDPNKISQTNTLSSSSPLYLASLNGYAKAVEELLLFKDIKVNAETNGITAFYVAVQGKKKML